MGNFEVLICHIKPHNISGAPKNSTSYFQLAMNLTYNIDIVHDKSLHLEYNTSNYSKKIYFTYIISGRNKYTPFYGKTLCIKM